MLRCASGRCAASSIRWCGWASRSSPRPKGGRVPLTLRGPRETVPIVYETPAASAQIKSAVLLAGLNSPGRTTVIEREATRDHTERMLRHFGAKVTVEPEGEEGRRITVAGQPTLTRQPGRRAVGPVLGGVPARRGADRARLGGRHRRRDDEPAADRAPRHPPRDGRRDRAPRRARRGRRDRRRSARPREPARRRRRCRRTGRRR